MQSLPHRYSVSATGGPQGPVPVSADELPTIETGVSGANGGSGDRWSPEQLLVAAVADAFVLSFRDVAARQALEWRHLSCQVDGVLDTDADEVTRFVEIAIQAEVVVPSEGARADAARCLDQAEQDCFITNSLSAQRQLHQQIMVSAD